MIFISQNKYTGGLLKKFKMYNCKIVITPLMKNEKIQKDDGGPEADTSQYKSLIGSLLCSTTTWLYIMYAASFLSIFMHNLSQIHSGAGKRILNYLQGTKEYVGVGEETSQAI